MLSDMQRPSLSSVVIKSVDRARVEQAVREYAARLFAAHPEIERIIWFGSWVNGIPRPGSDVDLCLILSSTDKPMHERAADFLPVGFPVGVDLFVYTRAEFERLQAEYPGWFQAIASGSDLAVP
jgi:predicted nucleotidyltransferase